MKNTKRTITMSLLGLALGIATVAGCRQSTEPAGAAWTCPMHSQIVRKEPGKCPICGMALVPEKPKGTAPAN